MPKKVGVILMTIGAVLIVSALLLFAYNKYEDYSAGQEAEILLKDVISVIEESTPSVVEEMPTSATAETDETLSSEQPIAEFSSEMPVVNINGYEYVGYISVPALELELPVMSEWDYDRLKIAPCRQFGSSQTDDLVIAAHNYESHFGRLSSLETGADVLFTDMDGIVNYYTVQSISTLAPDDVNAVQNSGYDLVLYTCTPGGKTRVAVFCNKSQYS